jgi:hypothetical protein
MLEGVVHRADIQDRDGAQGRRHPRPHHARPGERGRRTVRADRRPRSSCDGLYRCWRNVSPQRNVRRRVPPLYWVWRPDPDRWQTRRCDRWLCWRAADANCSGCTTRSVGRYCVGWSRVSHADWRRTVLDGRGGDRPRRSPGEHLNRCKVAVLIFFFPGSTDTMRYLVILCSAYSSLR